MKIIQNLLPPSKYGIKSPYEMDPEVIVVHNTANDATAANEIAYMIRNDNQVSFHYAIDDQQIVQGILENRNGWHAGDGGKGKGNRKGIAIEICYSKSGGIKFIEAEKLAAKFIAFKLKEKGWGIDKVTKHQDYSGKYCPHRTLDMGWQRFLDIIQSHRVESKITEGTSIMGKAECTAAQLEAFLLSKNPSPNLNINVSDFCKLWITEGEAEGVRGDIGFCQACHETGYFKYGGIVLPDQNNYGGIGALNGNASGNAATFPDPKTGIQASIQHLKAYGSKDPLVNPLVDPRFKLVTRGIAPHFEDLGGRWAWPGYDKKKYSSLEAAKAAGETYGHSIMKKYDDMIKIKVQDPDPLPDPNPNPIPVKELDPRIKEVEQLLQKAIAILQSIN
jgi:hypothetical protein